MCISISYVNQIKMANADSEKIFKVHWSEPQGASSDGAPSVSGKHEIQNRFGTKFFVGFRRFIVIANDQGHCTCVYVHSRRFDFLSLSANKL